MQIQHPQKNITELVLWRADALSCQTGSLHARMSSIPGNKILGRICFKSYLKLSQIRMEIFQLLVIFTKKFKT